MFRNNLKIIWRNMVKDRLFSMLNLLGLSTGLACALLIYLWINDEWNVDRYNREDKRLYQVMQNLKTAGGIKTMSYTAGLLGKALPQSMPEIAYGVSVLPASWFPFLGVVSYNDLHMKAGGQYVSRDYFHAFTLDYTDGDKNRLFADKSSVAISDELAKKLFNTTQNLVGKILKWDQSEFGGSFVISGVFKKTPPSATDQFDLLFNYDLVLDRRPNLLNWGNSDPSTFVLLKKGADFNLLNSKIEHFVEEKEKGSGKTLFLTRFSDRYLYGSYENGVLAGGRIVYIRLFSIIG